MNVKKINVEALKDKANEFVRLVKKYATQYASAVRMKMNDRMKNVDLSFMNKVHFNFHHFTTVSMVATLAFFVTLYSTGYNTATVNAEGLKAPEMDVINKERLNVGYGETDAVAAVAKDVLTDEVSDVVEPKMVAQEGTKTVYEVGPYMMSVELEENKPLGEQKAIVSVETKTTYEKNDMEKIVTYAGAEEGVQEGTVYKYQVALNVQDTEEPNITMLYDDMTIADTDEFAVEDYLIAITDNVDGIITDYQVEGMFGKEDGKWEPGNHYLNIRATDSSGNPAVFNLIVRVTETEDEEEVVAASSNSSRRGNGYGNNTPSYAGDFAGAGSVASAALAQVGVYQDCTMLVTNALRAVGIYFHSAPAGYLSLGTVVPASQAQAGDLIYYANGGMGVAHIAVYIGGGMAVHGGFNGNQTVVTTAYLGSGPVFIRLG